MDDWEKDSLFDPQSCVLSTAPSQMENVIGKEENHTNRDLRPPQPYLATGYFIPASELMEMEFQDPLWLVRGLLPKGLSVLGGKPKTGKSWLALDLALALTSGRSFLGHPKIEPISVCYLALEDTLRRLQDRILKLNDGLPTSNNLFLATSWENFKSCGLTDLEFFLDEHDDVKLLIVDTWGRVRGPIKSGRNIYGEDYDDVAELKELADNRGIAVLLVHHLKKAGEEDPLDQVSGSTGITGAADAVLVLERKRHGPNGKLHVTGRDVVERELNVSFDKETCTWSLLGDADHFDFTPEQREVLQALQEQGPMKPKLLADLLGMTPNTAAQRLRRMMNDGLIDKLEDGSYAVPV